MKRLREQGIHPVDFEPIDESESTNVAAETVRSRHESGLSRRRVHERGRETLSTLPGSGKLKFADGKHSINEKKNEISFPRGHIYDGCSAGRECQARSD